ncbi:hypothetical protein [Armatimonas rosea]|uniref:Putative lipoprotein n=1 Tax=Armatimonas rosea TaxID=685828 RepID=A0A7W9SMI2_ARMRO|nr:hypothetical protein [Armatimonas rosea]MBB6049075.1 putative lipoprotein [Armatimonas rosea]
MKTLILLAIGLLALAGCSPKPEATTDKAPPTGAGAAAPVQAAPGAPPGANQPLTDGRMDKSDNGK